MDDSIAALHTNKYGIRRSYNVSSDSEGAVDNEDLTRKSSAEGEIVQDSADTVGVILKRPNYYTIPPLNELKSYLDGNGDCFVEDFTIGREGYGNVVFPGKINVAGLNLDEIGMQIFVTFVMIFSFHKFLFLISLKKRIKKKTETCM